MVIVMTSFVDVNPPGPDQTNRYGPVPPAGTTLKIASAPAHTALVGGVTVQVGSGFTIFVALQLPTQPFASVTVAVKTRVPTVVAQTRNVELPLLRLVATGDAPKLHTTL